MIQQVYTDEEQCDMLYIQYFKSRSNGATQEEAYKAVVKLANSLDWDCEVSDE